MSDTIESSPAAALGAVPDAAQPDALVDALNLNARLDRLAAQLGEFADATSKHIVHLVSETHGLRRETDELSKRADMQADALAGVLDQVAHGNAFQRDNALRHAIDFLAGRAVPATEFLLLAHRIDHFIRTGLILEPDPEVTDANGAPP